ncbi:unnamed protein product [Diamesa tonsa]
MDNNTNSVWQEVGEKCGSNLMILGILGNVLTLIVLSRPCIRSSTTVYLSSLAFADIFFLILIFIISKQFRADIHDQSHDLYWRMFGLSHWFYNAIMFITIYITVSVVIDRYISITNPKKKPAWSITRAKNIVSIVVVFCFLFTISAAFEYQLITEEKFVEIKSGEACKYNQTKVELNYMNNVVQKDSSHDVIVDVVSPLTTLSNNKNHFNDANMVYHRIIRSLDNEVISTDYIHNNNNNNTLNNDTNNDDFIDVNDTKRDNITIIITRDDAEEQTPNVNDNLCHNQFYLYPVESSMAKNKYYQAIFKSMASILSVFLPLTILMIFNCMLATSVYKAHIMRHNLAALSAGTEGPNRSDTLIVQENKITMVLITLIVIFLICHTPTAVYMLWKESWNGRQTTSEKKIKNSMLAMRNILLSINSSCKILVYLIMYDDFWTSLTRCFCSCSANAPKEPTVNTSQRYFPSTKADIENLLSYSLNKKQYGTQIPKEGRHYKLQSISVPRPSRQSISSFNPSLHLTITPRMSLTPSDYDGIQMGRKHSQTSMQLHLPTDRRPSFLSIQESRELQSSASQSSLTRSKSMTFKPCIKHSPNCQHNKKF